MTVVTDSFYNYYYILFTNYFVSMFSCLRARGFGKTGVTCVICHTPMKGLEGLVVGDFWSRFGGVGFCIVELGTLVGFHVLRRAADNDEASAAAGADSLKTQFYEGSAHVDGTEFLADAGTDDLQGSCHGHELACFRRSWFAEVQVHQLLFEMGCLELSVMFVQLLDFFFLKPILEAALVEGVGFGIDGIVVERVLSGGDDMLYFEGEPTTVACGVGQELRVVACATEGGDVLAMLMIVGVGGSLVDARHRDDGFELVQLGGAHCIEFFAAHQGVLGESEEVVLAHAIRIGFCIEILLQLRGEEVVEPGGFEGALFAYQHEDDVVDCVVGEPTGYHRHEPLLQVMLPTELLRGTTFHSDGLRQFVDGFKGTLRFFSKITPSLFTIKEGSTSHPDPLALRGEGETAPTRRSEPLRFKVVGGIRAPRLIFYATELRLFVRCYTALLRACLRSCLLRGCLRSCLGETGEVILEGIERGDVVGLDDAVEVLLVDSGDGGHFCPKGVDLSVVDREPLIAFLALLVGFQIFYSCGDFIIT